MPKRILIATAIIVAAIALGATALYITLRQGGKEVARQEEVATTTEETTAQPEKPVAQPEEPITTQPEELKQPTTTEPIDTSDWKIYRNEKYGFEVKYPLAKSLKPISVRPILCNIAENILSSNKCPYITREGFIVNANEVVESDLRQGFVAQMEKISVGGHSYCFQILGEPAAGTVTYFNYYIPLEVSFERDKCFILEISYHLPNCEMFLGGDSTTKYEACQKRNQWYSQLPEKILSTFRFIKN